MMHVLVVDDSALVRQAFSMLLTGKFIDAQTAERWGLINRVVPSAELDSAVKELVDELSALSPLALKIGKEGFYKQVELPQAEAYELMSEAISCNAIAKDGQEGISAFIDKRKPNWSGE